VSPPDSRRPYWLWKTRRLFPHPLFAGCVSLAFLAVGVLFAGVAINVEGAWPMGVPGILFFLGCFATAAAAVAPSHAEPPQVSHDARPTSPTFALFVLLIGLYSWLLTGAMHVWGACFKNGPGSSKYLVTVGLAIASTAFMRLHGNRIVREHFGATGARDVELTGRQAVSITIFVVALGIYAAWLMA
jgi:hypothetical protein